MFMVVIMSLVITSGAPMITSSTYLHPRTLQRSQQLTHTTHMHVHHRHHSITQTRLTNQPTSYPTTTNNNSNNNIITTITTTTTTNSNNNKQQQQHNHDDDDDDHHHHRDTDTHGLLDEHSGVPECAFVEVEDGVSTALQPVHRLVVVQTDQQEVTELTSLLQCLDVPHIEQVKGALQQRERR